ncbi:MAG: 50S ribosomal protein L25 [bacterium]|nr:50S ribosomal protein L25 [bacterium]
MQTITINATARITPGETARALRRGGKLPAVLYGHAIAAQSIAVTSSEFQRAYRSTGASTLVSLHVDSGTPVLVLVKDVTYDPITDVPIHVDFHQVNLNEEVQAEIPLHFIGESPAVKMLGGLLVRQHEFIEVRAMPDKLVHDITVDISVLDVLDRAIHMKDLQLPEGVTPVLPGETVIAKVVVARQEAEEAPVVPAADASAAATAGAAKPETGAAAKT